MTLFHNSKIFFNFHLYNKLYSTYNDNNIDILQLLQLYKSYLEPSNKNINLDIYPFFDLFQSYINHPYIDIQFQYYSILFYYMSFQKMINITRIFILYFPFKNNHIYNSNLFFKKLKSFKNKKDILFFLKDIINQDILYLLYLIFIIQKYL
jgi:hypothetical protein